MADPQLEQPKEPQELQPEGPPAGSLASETLVAMTGIFPTRGPNELEIRGSGQNYLARVRRRIAAFLASTKIEPMRWTRPPSQKHLWAELVKQTKLEELDDWFDGWQGDPAVHVEYFAVVAKARDFIKNAWPIYPDNSLGLHTFELAPDEYGDVWHLCRTLNYPETIFDDLDSMLLLPEQVKAIAAIYPALYAEICKLTMALLQPYAGIDGAIQSKTLPGEREEQIRTLLQVPNDGPISAQSEQTPTAQSKDNGPDRAEITDVNQTPSEHVAQRRLMSK
jgi:hypothetical protein